MKLAKAERFTAEQVKEYEAYIDLFIKIGK
jgi:hypothetical protein